MANNPNVNKVVYGNTALIDLTQDTITPDKVVKGYTAHDKSGAGITGTMGMIPVPLFAYDYEMGYTDRGVWKYQNSTNNHTDVYEVVSGHRYLLTLGGTVGTRFRSAVLPTNPVGSTVDITGTQVTQLNNPAAYANTTFTARIDGYLVITKDNASVTGLKSWLFDIDVD